MTGSPIVTALRAAGCVFAEEEAQLLISHAHDADELSRLVSQRIEGIPLEHLVGSVLFCGVRIAVDPGVFVPRRRSELLVLAAAELARPGGVIVDVCCGSGAVGVALATRVPGARLHCVDVDPVAVACAQRNVAAVGGHSHLGDLYAPLPGALRGRVDVIVANAPYVPSDHLPLLPPEARLHEPRLALDGGPDGLDVQRRLIAAAGEWLTPGGHLLVETSEPQVRQTVAAAQAAGLAAGEVRSEELGGTVVVATRTARWVVRP